MNAAERTNRLIQARHLQAAKKRHHTLKTIDAVLGRGDRVTFAGIAHEAAVSGWFVRNQPDIRAAIEDGIDAQQRTGLPDKRTISKTSDNGLRSDLMLAREEIRELRRERDKLRAHLRQNLGAELDHASRSELLDRITALDQRNHTLETEHNEAIARASHTEAELATATADLEAARAANRRLIRDTNTRDASR
ncbi:MAG: DUF6262 family protein [Nakamurella sp.]